MVVRLVRRNCGCKVEGEEAVVVSLVEKNMWY